jgi:5-methylcytosine-specific restriction enzyme subunit McrC
VSEPIEVFEHDKLKVRENELTKDQLLALQRFHGDRGVPYYSLIHNGVKFAQHVGVIQVGDLTIHVLPKIDRQESDKRKWSGVLIDMLRQCGLMNADAPSSSGLRLKTNSILELYFELFIAECETLVHAGLIKKYRSNEGNLYALKGSLKFAQQINKNLVHAERFYTRHTVYDHDHEYNRILYMGLLVLARINTSAILKSKIESLLLKFPELSTVKVTPALFERLQYNRKTESYRKAIEIAQLILLNYHPDIQSGSNHVLALMFNMNDLWERWVIWQLRKQSPPDIMVKGQSRKVFWETEKSRKRLKPDILLYKKGEDDPFLIIDTKWKTPDSGYPSDEDLRQIYAYLNLYKCEKGILLYPGKDERVAGTYLDGGELNCEQRKLDILGLGNRLDAGVVLGLVDGIQE